MFHIIFDEQVTLFFLITRIVFDKNYVSKTIQRELCSIRPIKICFTKSKKKNIYIYIYIYIYSCQRKASLGGKNKNIYVFLVIYLISLALVYCKYVDSVIIFLNAHFLMIFA